MARNRNNPETQLLNCQYCNMADDSNVALKLKIRQAFTIFDREARNACDVREVALMRLSLRLPCHPDVVELLRRARVCLH